MVLGSWDGMWHHWTSVWARRNAICVRGWIHRWWSRGEIILLSHLWELGRSWGCCCCWHHLVPPSTSRSVSWLVTGSCSFPGAAAHCLIFSTLPSTAREGTEDLSLFLWQWRATELLVFWYLTCSSQLSRLVKFPSLPGIALHGAWFWLGWLICLVEAC